ncbi:1-deoxy-D-xylulose-5-phosphate synthase [Clostridium cavendishii DSM 21758]|uniref:1-deoxy-D-xylulose-5-phosphate synthase n=1 Tax=Clostridium cavendishii DSM 21758 TaxID=1121302 RepID=A0A1M6KJG9_9CLOT|nr:1-deoxy-D-xylulose-5-phosphate synthase [Clostridium cavendishii]SHJ59128.1 1-deoxy-D-xylulose-5-phosphate synthase [Clostridium cavendishii DSM 21758]
MYKILENIKSPNDIRKLTNEELNQISDEIRRFLIEKVSKTGGHLASNLGVVELTLGLYKNFNFDFDKVIWDVGHQSYVHKILTGRMSSFDTLRKYNGLSGFPKRCESKYDFFETGHSSTSISAALGMARARDLLKQDHHVIAVIGDGALTGGMALEALNDVGYNKTRLIIILNDNQMSISKNVGGISKYLSKVRVDPSYNKIKNEVNEALNHSNFGKNVASSLSKIKDSIKQLVVPSMLFEEMGVKYLGPVDGHNIREFNEVLSLAKQVEGPVIIHTVTQKGRGYNYAESNPKKFHGVGPFDYDSGEIVSKGGDNYSKAFGNAMLKLASENDKLVAITAAMPDGTGLIDFLKKYPKRLFDVGIAEQHATTLAAGMARAGLKPVFAVYSTFLQRAYDQVLHDVCIQKLPVTFAIDRAGIVGEDGETHQGIFDISYLNMIPNMTIVAPKCMEEIEYLLRFALDYNNPIAIRYPRGGDYNIEGLSPIKKFEKGKWETILKNGDIAIIAIGRMLQNSYKASKLLNDIGVETTVINASFIKPLDETMLKDLAKNYKLIITVEDNVIKGGFGSSVLSYVNTLEKKCKVVNLGYKDEFIPHGDVNILYKLCKLDPEGIKEQVLNLL